MIKIERNTHSKWVEGKSTREGTRRRTRGWQVCQARSRRRRDGREKIQGRMNRYGRRHLKKFLLLLTVLARNSNCYCPLCLMEDSFQPVLLGMIKFSNVDSGRGGEEAKKETQKEEGKSDRKNRRGIWEKQCSPSIDCLSIVTCIPPSNSSHSSLFSSLPSPPPDCLFT